MHFQKEDRPSMPRAQGYHSLTRRQPEPINFNRRLGSRVNAVGPKVRPAPGKADDEVVSFGVMGRTEVRLRRRRPRRRMGVVNRDQFLTALSHRLKRFELALGVHLKAFGGTRSDVCDWVVRPRNAVSAAQQATGFGGSGAPAGFEDRLQHAAVDQEPARQRLHPAQNALGPPLRAGDVRSQRA